MNPLKLGTFAAAAAAVMLLVDLLYAPVFTPQFLGVGIPLWGLAAVYAGLQFYVWIATRKGIELSDREVEKGGPKLERVAPEIRDRMERGTSVKLIASDLQRSEGIPRDVTLRYIIALGKTILETEGRDASPEL